MGSQCENMCTLWSLDPTLYRVGIEGSEISERPRLDGLDTMGRRYDDQGGLSYLSYTPFNQMGEKELAYRAWSLSVASIPCGESGIYFGRSVVGRKISQVMYLYSSIGKEVQSVEIGIC